MPPLYAYGSKCVAIRGIERRTHRISYLLDLKHIAAMKFSLLSLAAVVGSASAFGVPVSDPANWAPFCQNIEFLIRIVFGISHLALPRRKPVRSEVQLR